VKNRTGTLEKHLEPGSVYRNIVRKYGHDTGINAEVNGLCVHSLRAMAATNALPHEADITKVQEWLGHANVSTTRLYDRRKSKPRKGIPNLRDLAISKYMGNGIIYGNVQFAFPWRNQIRRRHCYWVEAMTAYSPKAYRILLTDRDLSQSNRRPRNAHKGLIRAVWFPPLYSLPSCHGKGTKTSAESFLIDTGISEASIWKCRPETFDQRRRFS